MISKVDLAAPAFKRQSSNGGFSLIELVLAIGILGSVAIFAITMLGTQMENRNSLTLANESQHTLHAAMARIYDDIRHVYLPTKKDAIFANVSKRDVKPQLIAKPESMIFTFQANQSLVRDSGQSNIGVVWYHQRKDPENPNRTQLIRTVDTRFKDDVEKSDSGQSVVLVGDLKSLEVTWWNGEDFRQEWHTEQGDTQGVLPKMARIQLAIFRSPSPEEAEKLKEGTLEADSRSVLSIDTIVYLLYSKPFEQIKNKSNEYTWR